MARIKKQGLDYFPINTDFIHDRLVRRIMKREGDASLAILIEVLSYIYAGEGYYVQADSLFYEDLSSNLYEKSSEDVKRIIGLAVEYGVFDGSLFGKFGILTSADIQRQYLFSTKRRNISHLDAAYCLISEELASKSSKIPKGDKQTNDKSRTVNSVKETNDELFEEADGKQAERGLNANVKKAKDVTFITENVTPGAHSIAQNSRAQHSVAENRINSPSPASPEAGKEELPEEESFSEINVTEERRTEGLVEKSVGELAEKRTEKSAGKRAEKCAEKRHEWTNETIDELQPPADGIERNYNGLIYNLRLYGIPPSEQYAIIRKSNFGVIGNPVWKGFCSLRDCCGKIKLPGRYLLSVLN